MKETLICSLEKHNIYYLSDANVSFYILVPYKAFILFVCFHSFVVAFILIYFFSNFFFF